MGMNTFMQYSMYSILHLACMHSSKGGSNIIYSVGFCLGTKPFSLCVATVHVRQKCNVGITSQTKKKLGTRKLMPLLLTKYCTVHSTSVYGTTPDIIWSRNQ